MLLPPAQIFISLLSQLFTSFMHQSGPKFTSGRDHHLQHFIKRFHIAGCVSSSSVRTPQTAPFYSPSSVRKGRTYKASYSLKCIPPLHHLWLQFTAPLFCQSSMLSLEAPLASGMYSQKGCAT